LLFGAKNAKCAMEKQKWKCSRISVSFVVGRLGNTGCIEKNEAHTHRFGRAYKETSPHKIYLLSSFEYRK